MFWYFFIYFVLGLFLPLFNPVEVVPANLEKFSFNVPYAIAIYIGIFCFAHAFYKLDATTMGPLSNLGNNIFTPLLALLVLGEKIPSCNLPWYFLVIAAGFFVVYDERLKLKFFLNKYVYVYLIWVLCLSITRIASNRGTNTVGFWNFTFYQLFYGGIALLAMTLPFVYKRINVDVKPILFLIPGVILEFLGLLFVIKAFFYQVIMPAIIGSFPLSSIVAFLISRLSKRLLEYHPLRTYKIRFLGIIALTVGLIKLALG